jgi:hypothetical protein
MLRWVLLALLISSPGWAAITYDSTACSGGSAANCPHGAADLTGTKPSIATPSFSTGAATTMLAIISESSNCSTTRDISSVTNTGTCTLTTGWTRLLSKLNVCGTAVIYYAVASGACSGVVVTAAMAPNSEASIIVIPITSTIAFGNSATVDVSAAASSATVTGTTAGSQIFAVGNDSADGTDVTRTANASQLYDDTDFGADRLWAEFLASVSSGGSVTIGVTAPTTQSGAFIAQEVCDGSCGAVASAPPQRSLMGVGQ